MNITHPHWAIQLIAIMFSPSSSYYLQIDQPKMKSEHNYYMYIGYHRK